MEKSEKMVVEITKKRKMTDEVNRKLLKNIFFNFLLAIAIMAYICVENAVYIYCSDYVYNIISKFLIIISVIMFEIAYKKDSGKVTIYGIELLVFSVIILYMPMMFINLDKFYSKIFLLTPLYCAIYYVGKSIVIYKKTEKVYQNSLSDVKEILKEETKV